MTQSAEDIRPICRRIVAAARETIGDETRTAYGLEWLWGAIDEYRRNGIPWAEPPYSLHEDMEHHAERLSHLIDTGGEGDEERTRAAAQVVEEELCRERREKGLP